MLSINQCVTAAFEGYPSPEMLVFGRETANLIQDLIKKELKGRNIIKSSQHGFMGSSPCPTRLFSFAEDNTHVADRIRCPGTIKLYSFGLRPALANAGKTHA